MKLSKIANSKNRNAEFEFNPPPTHPQYYVAWVSSPHPWHTKVWGKISTGLNSPKPAVGESLSHGSRAHTASHARTHERNKADLSVGFTPPSCDNMRECISHFLG